MLVRERWGLARDVLKSKDLREISLCQTSVGYSLDRLSYARKQFNNLLQSKVVKGIGFSIDVVEKLLKIIGRKGK